MSRKEKVHFWSARRFMFRGDMAKPLNRWNRVSLCGRSLGEAGDFELPPSLESVTCGRCMNTNNYKKMMSIKMANRMKGRL
jgi:hypothetical protein